MTPYAFMHEHDLHIRKMNKKPIKDVGMAYRTQYTYEVYKPGMKRGTGYVTYFSPPAHTILTVGMARNLICAQMQYDCGVDWWNDRDGDDRIEPDEDDLERIAGAEKIRDLFGITVMSMLHHQLVETD